MSLLELPPPELSTYRRQLREIDWSDTEPAGSAPAGEWTESCRLEIAREDGDPIRVSYDRFSTGSLALDRARRLIEDLVTRAAERPVSLEIPATYEPRIGDRLQRDDGRVFEIVGFTSDGKGVELAGADEPVTLYLERSELRSGFRRLLGRREGP